VQAKRRESYEATGFKVHHAQLGSLPQGLLKVIAKMHHQGPSQVRPQGNPRGGTWLPLERTNGGCQNPQGRLLLAYRPEQLHRVYEEVRQVPETRFPTPPQAGNAA